MANFSARPLRLLQRSATRGCQINQSLQAELDAVMPAAVATGLFSSLATFQAPDGLYTNTGAPSGTYANVAGLVNVPCMDAVPSISRVQATEAKSIAEIMAAGFRHLLLDGYYPESTPDGQIPTNWRVIVDGCTYDLLGVEHDSQNQMSRLELRLVIL